MPSCMYECMYVCMYVCTCMHVFMYACMYVCMYVSMYVYTHLMDGSSCFRRLLYGNGAGLTGGALWTQHRLQG